ncbi:MAG: hypothetical protein FJ255_08130 [Phycisphaerae bacterium]|nr:hypothetical protein [Phycisphaerae bacterium]
MGVEPGAAGERRFPCEACGAVLAFAPGTALLKCAHCGHENPIPEPCETAEEQDFHARLADLARAEPTESHPTLKCDACAAEVDRPANITSLSCPFCGSNIVANERCPTRIRPRSLLPFAVTTEQARDRYRKWIGGLWFVPGALKQFARQDEKLTGIYTPYWTYDCAATTRYTGFRGEHYWATVGSGKNRRTELRTRWYPASGTVHNRFDDVLVLASQSLPRAKTEALEPWDLKGLVPYDDGYLAGFRAESYQVDLAQGFERAKQIMAGTIDTTIRRDIGGDAQRIVSRSIRYEGITFKHVLLPVWLSVYRFKGKAFRFLVNARTGEVQGERPYSWVKITAAVVGALAIVAIIVLIVQARGG